MYDIYRTDRIGIVVRQRDLDQEFLGREYLLDTRDTYHNDDLEERSMSNRLIEILRYVASSMWIVQTHWRWITTFLVL